MHDVQFPQQPNETARLCGVVAVTLQFGNDLMLTRDVFFAEENVPFGLDKMLLGHRAINGLDKC